MAGSIGRGNFASNNFGNAGRGNFTHNNFAHSGVSHNSFGQNNFAHNANFNRGGFNNFAGNRGLNGFNSRWNGGWNNWNNRSYFFGGRSPFGGYYRGFYPYGYGYGFGRGFWPWWGFGLGYYPYYSYGYGYPYGGYGYGYPSYSNGYGYPGYSSYGYGYPSSSYGYGYDNYSSYGYPTDNSVTYAPAAGYATNYGTATPPAPSPDNQPPTPDAGVATAPTSPVDMTAADFAGQGEIDFKAGKYDAAVRDFRHALVDDPANAGVLMLLGQSLFAVGQFDEAAGATAMALSALPQDKWGAVMENYKQLYANPDDYTSQLRALEKARDAQPDSPALHFMLGYQYSYLGYRDQAIRELDKTLQLEPKDRVAKSLRDRLGGAATPPPPAPDARPNGLIPKSVIPQLGLDA